MGKVSAALAGCRITICNLQPFDWAQDRSAICNRVLAAAVTPCLDIIDIIG
jgi:hypothetical protein